MLRRIFLIILVSSLFTSSIYSSCLDKSIQVSQNGFIQDASDSDVSVKSDLISSPLFIDFIFNGSCYTESNDITLRDGFALIVDPLNQDYDSDLDQSIIRFALDNFVISSFKSFKLYKSSTEVENLVLYPDDSEPTMTITVSDSESNPLSNFIRSGENVTFRIQASDINSNPSGVSHVIVNNAIRYNFTGSVVEFSQELFQDFNFNFQVYDFAGNSVSESVFIQVDSSAPQISGFSIDGTRSESSKIFFSFSVVITDDNFNGDLSAVVANFSTPFDFAFSSFTPTSCIELVAGSYNCAFSNIETYARETINPDLTIMAVDTLGNTAQRVFPSVEIFIDNAPPQVNDLYFMNSFGGRNIVSPAVNGSIYLQLEYDDDSRVDIYEDFGFVDLPLKGEGMCFDSGCYFWNFSTGLNSNFAPYLGLTNSEEEFMVELVDDFGNRVIANQTLFFDRLSPSIQSVEIIEAEEPNKLVIDSLIESEEKFNVIIKILENQLTFEPDLTVLGNFSSVAREQGLIEPRCEHDFNESLDLLEYTCVFENLEARIGPINNTFSISVIDSAGNRDSIEERMFIYGRADQETPDIFEISTLNPLAAVSRTMLSDVGVGEPRAWYDGRLRYINSEDSEIYSLVNYQLIECLDFDVEEPEDVPVDLKLLLAEFRLYPPTANGAITFLNSPDARDGGIDRDFSMYISLRTFDNPTLLNDVSTTCTFSALFRDDEVIYEPPQIFNVTVNLDFYDIPRGNLLEAYAEDLKEDLETIRNREENFGSLYDTYEQLDNICTTINNVCTVATVASNVMVIAEIALDISTVGKSISEIMANMEKPATGQLNMLCLDEDNPIKQFCNYVTCEMVPLSGVKEFFENAHYKWGGAICSDLNQFFLGIGGSSSNTESNSNIDLSENLPS